MGKNHRKFQKERPPKPTSIEAMWRLFIAVPMPPPATALVEEIVAELAAEAWPVRWIAAESAHLTLHFLGDTEPERAELLRLGLRGAVARHTAFTLQIGNLGVFPDERRPRVIWLGLQGQTQRLVALHADLAATLQSLGFPIEDRALRPHITLGRVRDNPPPDLPEALRRRLHSPALRERVTRAAAPLPVREVHLVRSFLSREGARHEPLARYSLADPIT